MPEGTDKEEKLKVETVDTVLNEFIEKAIAIARRIVDGDLEKDSSWWNCWRR